MHSKRPHFFCSSKHPFNWLLDCIELCLAYYTALWMKNSMKIMSIVNPAIMENTVDSLVKWMSQQPIKKKNTPHCTSLLVILNSLWETKNIVRSAFASKVASKSQIEAMTNEMKERAWRRTRVSKYLSCYSWQKARFRVNWH